jgi:hypothetical protein
MLVLPAASGSAGAEGQAACSPYASLQFPGNGDLLFNAAGGPIRMPLR